MKNKLRIRAKSLNLDLEGEAEYVLRAYDAIHSVLLERFEESVEGVLEESERPEVAAKTMKLYTGADGKASPKPSREHLNLVICNEVYHKIHLVERQRLRKGVFGRSFDFEHVGGVYINRSQSDAFHNVLPSGKVLWRELTATGKAVVKGA